MRKVLLSAAGVIVVFLTAAPQAQTKAPATPDPVFVLETTKGVIEIRQVFESEEFSASDPTGELMKKEDELRRTLETRRH